MCTLLLLLTSRLTNNHINLWRSCGSTVMSFSRPCRRVIGAIVLITACGVVIAVITLQILNSERAANDDADDGPVPSRLLPVPNIRPAKLVRARYGAVTADGPVCSEIGRWESRARYISVNALIPLLSTQISLIHGFGVQQNHYLAYIFAPTLTGFCHAAGLVPFMWRKIS